MLAPARRLGGAVPRAVTHLRRHPPAEPFATVALVALSVLLTIGGARVSLSVFSPGTLALPLLVGGLLLSRWGLLRVTVVVAACLVFDLLDIGLDRLRVGALLVIVATGLVAYEFARSREETGLGGLSGDTVLVELRERLRLQGDLPSLPAGYHAEPLVKPAGGGPFAGDFIVSARTGSRVEIALVDVSGKGVDAGTRALLLSGAMGGLLGSRDPQEFFPAANAYLVRQNWDEGFATAVHVVLDTTDGRFVVSSAGHPPVAHLDAGSGRWSLLEASGPALGLLPEVSYEPSAGTLRPGDALVLYTDGLVEIPGRDLAVGIDKLLGEAERLVTRGFAGGAALLVDRVAEGSSDDRGLVLVWRT